MVPKNLRSRLILVVLMRSCVQQAQRKKCVNPNRRPQGTNKLLALPNFLHVKKHYRPVMCLMVFVSILTVAVY